LCCCRFRKIIQGRKMGQIKLNQCASSYDDGSNN
jgi:hypothetical protein